MKKIITGFLLCVLCTSFALPTFAEDEDYTPSGDLIKGYIETSTQTAPEGYFTGEQATVEKGKAINVTVNDVMSSGYTQVGDEFFAEISGEVAGGNGVVLPIGTVVHGHVVEMVESKRLGRDGWIELKFDSLITPDGREIPIEGKMTTKKNVVHGTAVKVVEDAGYTVVGGALGGLAVLNIFGLEAVIASQGYLLAGGAAVGGTIGLGAALYRKGKEVFIAPDKEFKVKILNDVDLPVINEEFLKQHEVFYDGLDVQLKEISVVKDPFGERNTIAIDMVIYNTSPKDFSTMDISLVNELDKKFYPSIFGDKTMGITQIKSGETTKGKLMFAVDNPTKPHWLVFYDRRTQKPLTKISLNNALRAIEREKQEHKKHKVSKNSKKDSINIEAN